MSDMIRHESFEETGSGPVFQPDTVLPTQFFTALRQRFTEGEKRLMAAVLTDAVEIYMKQAFATESRARQLFLDAETWIFRDEPGPWFFSFNNICDMLGLDPDYIRCGLVEWRQKRVPTIRPSKAFRRAPRTSHRAAPHGELKKAVG